MIYRYCFTVSELILKIQESVDGRLHQGVAFQKLTLCFVKYRD